MFFKNYVIRSKFIIIFLTSVLLFSGCSSLKGLFGGDGEDLSPDELMYEGMNNMRLGRYQQASEQFQMIKDRYPYHKYAVEAELKVADALFKANEWTLAFVSYDDFERLHPRHADIPYVIYQKGMCHFVQIRSFDRDQSFNHDAKEQFERLTSRYPNSEYANRAKARLRDCYSYLAQYEQSVGDFYFKRKHYRAAYGRYKYLLENYPDLGHYNKALEYMALSREMMEQDNDSD